MVHNKFIITTLLYTTLNELSLQIVLMQDCFLYFFWKKIFMHTYKRCINAFLYRYIDVNLDRVESLGADINLDRVESMSRRALV